MMRRLFFVSWGCFWSILAALMMSGCLEPNSGTSSTQGDATGTIRLKITDQPACGYDHVFVTVEKVLIHQRLNAPDADDGWQEIPLGAPKRIDLLTLTNGVLETLGQAGVPAGKYTQMRLILSPNGASSPWANSLVPTGGVEVPLTLPSELINGIKLNVDITVAPGQVSDFVMDFDACWSIVRQGNTGAYLLKPVIQVVEIQGTEGQRITGFVDPATMAGQPRAHDMQGGIFVIPESSVSAQRNGVVVKSTPIEGNGAFVLYPLAPGTYDLVIAATRRATTVVTDVSVNTVSATTLGSETARISLMDSDIRQAAGSVSLNGSALDTGGAVRAVQTLHNGPLIEVAGKSADSLTGRFKLVLPTAAPKVAKFRANGNPLSFADDSPSAQQTAAGKYRLVATAPGLNSQSANVELTTSLIPDTVFNFVSP